MKARFSKFLFLLIAFIPVVFFLHHLEKAYMIRDWVEQFQGVKPPKLSAFFPVFADYKSFYNSVIPALGLSLVIPCTIVLLAILIKKRHHAFTLLLITALSLLVNAVQHVAYAILTNHMQPGAYTASLLYIPYAILLLIQLQKEHELDHIPASVYYALPLVIYFPLFSMLLNKSFLIIYLF